MYRDPAYELNPKQITFVVLWAIILVVGLLMGDGRINIWLGRGLGILWAMVLLIALKGLRAPKTKDPQSKLANQSLSQKAGDIILPVLAPRLTLGTLIALWEWRRKQPEHSHQSFLNFYAWQVLKVMVCGLIFFSCLFCSPFLAILVDRQVPGISSLALGIAYFAFILVGLGSGFAFAKAAGKAITKFECRHHSTSPDS